MRFLLALALSSLSESLDCNSSFAIKRKYYGGPGVFIKKENGLKYNEDDCKKCLWLLGSNFDQSCSTATADRRKDMTIQLIENKPWGASTLGVFSDFSFRKSYKEANFIGGDVCCPEGFECTAKISWDGKNKFNLLGFSKNSPQRPNYDDDTSEWIYDFSDNQFNIYHSFTGGYRRKFFYRQIATIANGRGGFKRPGYQFGDRVYVKIYQGPVDITITETGKNGEISYVATVIGYVNH